jgi:ppGpp synthetase/RelA/SpoT-type nucleotidyltranferase
MTNGVRSPEEWGEIYERVRPTLRAFVDKLETLFDELLESYEWCYTWTEHEDSFIDRVYRARRAGVVFESPLQEMLGSAGLGIVVADLSRAQTAAETIERELEVNRDVSLLPSDPGSDSPFRQYFVSVPSTWAALSEWRPYEGLWVNIDVQTLMQYAWERADTDLPYYWHQSYPAAVREQFAEYSSLLAAADERFDGIWGALERLRSEYEDDVVRGNLDLELSAESLGAYLVASETVSELLRIGIAAGLDPDEEYEPNRVLTEQTLWLLRRGEIETIQQLDDFLQSSIPRAGDVLADIGRLSTEAGFTPKALPDSIVEWLFLVLRRADPETVSLVRFYGEIEDALNILIGNPVRPRDET